jgi:Shikimate kinase
MNLNKNIVLLGMMGSGKSSIGYLLSKSLNLKFIDIDKKIKDFTSLNKYEIF